MLTVEKLIDLLKNMDKGALVIVEGQTVDSIEGPRRGRLERGYCTQHFAENSKGPSQHTAVFLTRYVELSNGSVVLARI